MLLSGGGGRGGGKRVPGFGGRDKIGCGGKVLITCDTYATNAITPNWSYSEELDVPWPRSIPCSSPPPPPSSCITLFPLSRSSLRFSSRRTCTFQPAASAKPPSSMAEQIPPIGRCGVMGIENRGHGTHLFAARSLHHGVFSRLCEGKRRASCVSLNFRERMVLLR